MLGTVIRPAGSFIGTFPDGFKPSSKMSCSSSLRMKPRSPTISASVAEAEAPMVGTLRKPGNLYEVLRVRNNASASEIKSAYRNLAKIYHPDVAAATKHHPEESFDGCDFIEIHKAYSTLSDPSSRAVYDMTMRMGGGAGQQRRSAGIQNNGHSGFRNSSGFYTTRRWETDQCW